MLRRPCLVCGKPSRGARCPEHRTTPVRRKPPRAKLPRRLRGYDAEYERNRKAMADFAWQYGMPCVLCGQGFERKSDITAEHIVPVRSGGTADPANLGPAHQKCNSAYRLRSVRIR
jgi:5-methylcytosine-specific restriction endonuclease McrA